MSYVITLTYRKPFCPQVSRLKIKCHKRFRTCGRADAGNWLLPVKWISQARWGHSFCVVRLMAENPADGAPTPHASSLNSLVPMLYLRADPAPCAQSTLARRQKKVDQRLTWYLARSERTPESYTLIFIRGTHSPAAERVRQSVRNSLSLSASDSLDRGTDCENGWLCVLWITDQQTRA